MYTIKITNKKELDKFIFRSCTYKILNKESELESIKKEAFLRRIVLINGTFDPIHAGHVNLLNFSRYLGDITVVLINSDESIKKLKGSERPFLNQKDRAYILSSFTFVDYVYIFDEERITKYFDIIKPHIWLKGGDYNDETIEKTELNAAKVNGIKIYSLPRDIIEFGNNSSGTDLFNKIKNNNK